MEIFQTIWTALTTENELLTRFIILPVTFIESTINTLLFTTLLNVNNTKSVKKYIIFISIFLCLTGLLIPNPIRAIINFLLIFLSIFFFFKLSILKSIICLIVPTFFAILCESVVGKILMYLFALDIFFLSSIPLCRIVIALIIQLLLFTIYLLLKYSKIQISIIESMTKRTKLIFALNVIFAILALALQFLITGFYLNRLPIYIVFFSNISLIAYFLLSIFSLTKTTQLELTSLNLSQEKEHNKTLKLLQDDLQGFRHDFSNILCTISGYVQVDDMKGLKKYYSQIQKDINKVNNLGALNPNTINNPAIFALISSKYNEALELGIEMNINVFLNLNNLNMKIYEFTRILGILLDNAIQSSKECKDKIINIEIRKDSRYNRQLLIIENTYNNKEIDIDKIFEKNYSTKPKNSGLGLWEVRQILKKNNNLNLFTSKNEMYFSQQLEMYEIK